jgi:ribosomal protein S18 acetylase RimI-like enzyme
MNSETGNRFIFREFREEDFSEIQKLWELNDMGGSERGDTAETIMRCNKMGGKFIILHDTTINKITGTSWMTWDGRRILLHHFCIHPDYRRMGLGERLGIKSLEFIKKKKAQVKLEVHKNNHAAQHLYKKLGFFAFEDYDIFMIRNWKKI